MENTKTPKEELCKRWKKYWMDKCGRMKDALDYVNSKLRHQEDYIQQKKNRIETLCHSLEDLERKLSRANMKVSVYKTISWVGVLVIIIEIFTRWL